MLETLKELNQRRTEILWVIQIRSLSILEKMDAERSATEQFSMNLRKVAFSYYALSDQQLQDVLASLTFEIDQITDEVSLNDIASLLG